LKLFPQTPQTDEISQNKKVIRSPYRSARHGDVKHDLVLALEVIGGGLGISDTAFQPGLGEYLRCSCDMKMTKRCNGERDEEEDGESR
jgi:hypothetical protein